MAPSLRRRTSGVFPAHQRLHPLLITVIILVGGLALYYLIRMIFFGSAGNVVEAELHVPDGESVYVQFADDEGDFRSISGSTIAFWENEAVQSRTSDQSSLSFFDRSAVFLNEQTELGLEKSRKHDGEAREIRMRLEDGEIWGEVAPSLNPRSHFSVSVADGITVETRNGKFSLDADDQVIKVAQGTVRLSQEQNGDEVFFQDVSVGQQFSFAGNIADNALAILTPDAWFTLHQNPELASSEDTEDSEESEDEDENGSTPVPSGTIRITAPGTNGATVNVTSSPQEISGTVPEGTAKVVVNDYTLQKFAAGDSTFAYVASAQLGNLKAGRNTYTIEALDEDNRVISKAEITLVYQQPADEEEEDETPKPVTGALAITAPNQGNSYTATNMNEIVLSGTAPSNAAKIVVNGYTLSRYTAGSTTWTYRIRQDLGNMKAGANTYQVQALDASGKVLATDTITITFPESTPADEDSAPATTEDEDTTPAGDESAATES